MSTEPVLSVRNAARHYPGHVAVEEASFVLQPGRIAALLGPSGCGKSTLLRLIAGLETLDAGEIRLRGEMVSAPGASVPPEQRGVGLVFQDNALFPHLDVAANVGFGLRRLAAPARTERVRTLLEQLHVAHLERAWPHTLSGGEQQRVAIARAMAREPSLLLLDEPFSGLDGQLREQVRTALVADLRAAGATVLIVTHDPEEAMTLADDLILMERGRILQTGLPQDCYRRPVSLSAARLLGEAIVMPVEIAAGSAATPFGQLDAPDMAAGPAHLVLRPQHIVEGSGGAAASVLGSRFAGQFHRVDCDLAGHVVSVRLDRSPAIGETIALVAEREAASLIPATPR